MSIAYRYSKPSYFTGKIYNINRLSRTLYEIDINIIQDKLISLPPQFVLVCVPGYEAVPMSIAVQEENGGVIKLIVKPVGETTNKLVTLNNEYIGIIGPLGKPLLPSGDKILLLAGGSGVAPMLRFAQYYASLKKDITFVFGAWESDEIGDVPGIIRRYASEVITTCTNGCDIRGTVVDVLKYGYVREDEYDYVFVAGPEIMIRNIANYVKNQYKTIVIMERLVRCGLGLCGSCIISGTNKLLCYDGPGFVLSDIVEVLRQ